MLKYLTNKRFTKKVLKLIDKNEFKIYMKSQVKFRIKYRFIPTNLKQLKDLIETDYPYLIDFYVDEYSIDVVVKFNNNKGEENVY